MSIIRAVTGAGAVALAVAGALDLQGQQAYECTTTTYTIRVTERYSDGRIVVRELTTVTRECVPI